MKGSIHKYVQKNGRPGGTTDTYGVLKKAKARDKIEHNPADFERITLPKTKEKKAAVVEKPNFARFLEAAKPTRLYALVPLAAATGA